MQRYVFDPPERFVVGTVGQPGERAFYLQAAAGGRLVTVGLEKSEVTALAEGLTALLGQVSQQPGVIVPAAADVEIDLGPLQAPFEEDFHLGQLTVSWDGERVFVEAAGVAPGHVGIVEDESALDTLRVALTVAQTRAFIERARSVVAAGRPACVLCGRPDGPGGHFCPRLN
ncbi:MAG: DUF3090 family protein [Frankia sp.]|nr:DUF3090 family protein [Frankia sp.]